LFKRLSGNRGAVTAKRSLTLNRVYGLLEPGPVVMVTTAGRGHANIMTMSWHTMMEF
jgi:flavin reductase (DIM6/NTAB) family NADH-FMN oxidoreductase RutF